MDTNHMLLEFKITDMVLLSHCPVRTSYTEDTTFEMDEWTKVTKFSEQGRNYFHYMHIHWSNSKKVIRNSFLML